MLLSTYARAAAVYHMLESGVDVSHKTAPVSFCLDATEVTLRTGASYVCRVGERGVPVALCSSLVWTSYAWFVASGILQDLPCYSRVRCISLLSSCNLTIPFFLW